MIRHYQRSLVDNRLKAEAQPPLTPEEEARLEALGSWARLNNAVQFRMRDDAQKAAEAMAEAILDWRRKEAAQPVEVAERDRKPPVERLEAISRLFALEAAQDDDVRVFRERYLPDGLLTWKEVQDWIDSHLRLEGAPTRSVEVVLPEGSELRYDPSRRAFTVDPPLVLEDVTGLLVKVSVQALTYALPGDRSTRSIPIPRGGALDALRATAERLAKHYRWNEAAAAVFLLTGLDPLVSVARVTTEVRSLPAASRIVLSIDPALSDAQVAAIYKEQKRRLSSRRMRSITPKHLRLAVFAAERRPGMSWEKIRLEWNEENPTEQYSDRRRMERDCTDAQKRLLAPEMDYPGIGNPKGAE